jgi:hypothetical protein
MRQIAIAIRKLEIQVFDRQSNDGLVLVVTLFSSNIVLCCGVVVWLAMAQSIQKYKLGTAFFVFFFFLFFVFFSCFSFALSTVFLGDQSVGKTSIITRFSEMFSFFFFSFFFFLSNSTHFGCSYLLS